MRRNLRSFVVVVVLAALPVGLSAVIPQDMAFLGPVNFFQITTERGPHSFPGTDGTFVTYYSAAGNGLGIVFYDIATGNSAVIPQPSGVNSVLDYVPVVDSGRIVFARLEFGATAVSSAILVYDTSNGFTTEVARVGPGENGQQVGFVDTPAIGSNTVAFKMALDAPVSVDEMFVANLNDLGAAPTRLTHDSTADPRRESFPSVSPSGNIIVWDSCTPSNPRHCDIEKAVLTGNVWTVTRINDEHDREEFARTDGQWIAYHKEEINAWETADICWQPVTTGTEQCLELPGVQRYPSIAGGVIVFSSTPPGETMADLYAYQINTNRLFRITSTPDSEWESGVHRLPDGSFRIVWAAALNGNTAENNVYGADFSLPGVNTFTFGGFLQPVDSYPAFNVMKAGAAVPLRFSLGGFHGFDIFAADFPKSAPTQCGSSLLEAPVDETVTAGSSSLSYEPSTDVYTYVWKTDRTWAGSCRQVAIKLTDQTTYYANFKFK